MNFASFSVSAKVGLCRASFRVPSGFSSLSGEVICVHRIDEGEKLLTCCISLCDCLSCFTFGLITFAPPVSPPPPLASRLHCCNTPPSPFFPHGGGCFGGSGVFFDFGFLKKKRTPPRSPKMISIRFYRPLTRIVGAGWTLIHPRKAPLPIFPGTTPPFGISLTKAALLFRVRAVFLFGPSSKRL